MKKIKNPYITNLKVLNTIKLGEKLDKPEFQVDLIEDNFAPVPINFQEFEDCSVQEKIGEVNSSFNEMVEKINK